MARLAAYEDAMPIEWAQEIAQAEKDGRLVVLEPATKEGAEKPPCFYNDMGQALCLGFARGEYDNEPIDRCKECWYCESTHEEAEAALKKRGGKMKPGDKVVMNDKYYVSDSNKGKIWTVKSGPWSCCGTMVVKLEGKSGGYAVDGLDLVEEVAE